MAGASLLALIDDIATLLDDIAALSKVAAKKTAGVLGDDLAVNAEQVSGVKAERELPVVWAVAKGSFRNKFILVPAALLMSLFAPWLITPVLMLGGAFLCYEGYEKVHEWLFHKPEEHDAAARVRRLQEEDLVALEQEKIKGAIRTDFILSAEIVVITLGSVSSAPFSTQVMVVSGLALLFTAGVYGLVAAIVKMDDAGIFLMQRPGEGLWHGFTQKVGSALLNSAAPLMRTLTVVGTIAMFLVGGGILVHGMPFLHHVTDYADHWVGNLPSLNTLAGALVPSLINMAIGFVVGAVLAVGMGVVSKVRA
jgi:predicted DNA repair protein MutK